MMTYATPTALEMGVKAAAKASSLDTGRAVSGFYFHRFLCRIFSRQDSPFVLKGGQSMLARTADARATRDIDLLSEKADIDEALAELKHLAAIDLVFDRIAYGKSEVVEPADRIDVPDIPRSAIASTPPRALLSTNFAPWSKCMTAGPPRASRTL